MEYKDHPNHHENRHNLRWNRASHCEFDGKLIKTEMIASEFPVLGEAIVEQILALEEINEFKSAGLWRSQPGIWVGKLAIWVRSFEISRVVTGLTRSISSTRTG